MGKQKQISGKKRVAIIGDGKTEFLYIESLKEAFRDKLTAFVLQPCLPKDSSAKELDKFIEDNLSYDKVLCIIDMDTKLKKKSEMSDYLKLKQKYKKRNHVHFFETHPCTELWFHYHFQYTTSEFGLFEPELKRLLVKNIPGYEKKLPFCTHQHLLKCGGNFEKAVLNGSRSLDSKNLDSRGYTYSELVLFFKEIGLIDV